MAENNYFKKEGDYIYLNAPECRFYIPEDYFESTAGFAQDRGEMIYGIGLFDIGFFSDGKLIEMKILNIPTWIEMFVYESETKSVLLPRSDEPTLCRVLTFYKGSKIMKSTIIQDSENAVTFLYLVCSGKIPQSVPYSKASQIWKKNQSLNGVHLGVPAVIEEMVLSVTYRNKNNLGEKFCLVAGKDDNVSDYDYKMASIRQICQYSSTFTALTFEDFDSMVTTSLNRTAEHKSEQESPLEKIIKM